MLSQEAGAQVKQYGKDNDLVERIKKDPYFKPILDQLDNLLDPRTFVGRAPEQVIEFLEEEVQPMLENYQGLLDESVELNI